MLHDLIEALRIVAQLERDRWNCRATSTSEAPTLPALKYLHTNTQALKSPKAPTRSPRLAKLNKQQHAVATLQINVSRMFHAIIPVASNFKALVVIPIKRGCQTLEDLQCSVQRLVVAAAHTLGCMRPLGTLLRVGRSARQTCHVTPWMRQSCSSHYLLSADCTREQPFQEMHRHARCELHLVKLHVRPSHAHKRPQFVAGDTWTLARPNDQTTKQDAPTTNCLPQRSHAPVLCHGLMDQHHTTSCTGRAYHALWLANWGSISIISHLCFKLLEQPKVNYFSALSPKRRDQHVPVTFLRPDASYTRGHDHRSVLGKALQVTIMTQLNRNDLKPAVIRGNICFTDARTMTTKVSGQSTFTVVPCPCSASFEDSRALQWLIFVTEHIYQSASTINRGQCGDRVQSATWFSNVHASNHPGHHSAHNQECMAQTPTPLNAHECPQISDLQIIPGMGPDYSTSCLSKCAQEW
jgi:hypothetical protein